MKLLLYWRKKGSLGFGLYDYHSTFSIFFTLNSLYFFFLSLCIYDLDVGRILSYVRVPEVSQDHNGSLCGEPHKESQSKGAHVSQFLPTSRRIVQFSNGKVLFIWVILMQRLSCMATFFSRKKEKEKKKERERSRIMF